MNLEVYVLHATMLASRKTLCNTLNEKLQQSTFFKNVTFKYIESFDTKDIDTELIAKCVDLTKKGTSPFDPLVKGIHVRELSNALKHHEALTRVSNSSSSPENTISLILEDDVVYSDNVVERLYKTIQALKDFEKKGGEWDINFLGLPQPPAKEPNQVEINPLEPLFKIIPEISSYLVNKTGAKKLVDAFMPVKFTTNVHMSYLALEKCKDTVKFKMTTPNVFVDGSKFGVYLSSIKSNNKLILNQEFSKLYQMIKSTETFTTEAQKDIEHTIEIMKFNTHPEIQSLRGQYEMKLGNYQKAKEIFDACYQIYMANDCLLNGESEFLQVYTRVHKYLQ